MWVVYGEGGCVCVCVCCVCIGIHAVDRLSDKQYHYVHKSGLTIHQVCMSYTVCSIYMLHCFTASVIMKVV